jgi:hypothetical protein
MATVCRTGALVALALLASGGFVASHNHALDQSTWSCAACVLASTPGEAASVPEVELVWADAGSAWIVSSLPAPIPFGEPPAARGPPASC